MAQLDEKMAARVRTALRDLPPGTQPQWGSMTPAQLYHHLTGVLRYSMGEGPEMPDRSTWRNRLFRPLVLHGVIKIPRNVRVPKPKGVKERPAPQDGTFEECDAALNAWLARRQAGTLPVVPHPFFGPLDGGQWARFHAQHFRHHLTQFGVW